jgi:hypothetical protein
MWRKIRAILTQGMMATVASQCGGDDGKIFVPGGDEQGAITISVTDAPVDDASQVMVQFASIDLLSDTDDDINISLSNRAIDLLSLSDGASTALVTNQEIDSGTYTGIRFNLNATSTSQDGSFIITSTGQQFPLVLPNDADDLLTIDRDFTISDDSNLSLVVDFDLRSSIIQGSQVYTFRPVLRLVDNANAGIISGAIDSGLVPPNNCDPFIYIYSGSDVVPDDIDSADDLDPVVSVPVKLNVSSATYRYRASFLEAGNYTVAYTCQGALDNPETNEGLVFSRIGNAAVTANQTLTLDFN